MAPRTYNFPSLLIRDGEILHNTTGPIAFDSPSDRRGSIICASVIALFFAIFSTVLRVFARSRVGATLKADDYWIFFGCFMAANVVVSTFLMVHWGLGLHIDQISSAEGLAKAVLASQVFYATSIVPIKISILCLYHRIFPSKNLKHLSFAIATFVALYSAVLIICMLTQCVPLSKIWNPEIEARCFDINTVYTVMAVLNVFTDFLILCLPIKYVWGLELARARKVQVMGVFLLGSCVCAFGIVRAAVVGTASIQDQSFNDVGSAIWSEVEICVGVVSANLPCLRPLIRSLPKKLGGSTSGATPKPGLSYSRGRAKNPSRGIELANRRPKSGMDAAGWEKMDTDSDVNPFAKSTVTVTSPAHSRSPSRADGMKRSDMKAFDTAIVVETTIETRFDDRDSNQSRGSDSRKA